MRLHIFLFLFGGMLSEGIYAQAPCDALPLPTFAPTAVEKTVIRKQWGEFGAPRFDARGRLSANRHSGTDIVRISSDQSAEATAVFAVAAGVVAYAKVNSPMKEMRDDGSRIPEEEQQPDLTKGYGLIIVIDHQNGCYSAYAHLAKKPFTSTSNPMSEAWVAVGDDVKAGERLGYFTDTKADLDSTGNARGSDKAAASQVHFELFHAKSGRRYDSKRNLGINALFTPARIDPGPYLSSKGYRTVTVCSSVDSCEKSWRRWTAVGAFAAAEDRFGTRAALMAAGKAALADPAMTEPEVTRVVTDFDVMAGQAELIDSQEKFDKWLQQPLVAKYRVAFALPSMNSFSSASRLPAELSAYDKNAAALTLRSVSTQMWSATAQLKDESAQFRLQQLGRVVLGVHADMDADDAAQRLALNSLPPATSKVLKRIVGGESFEAVARDFSDTLQADAKDLVTARVKSVVGKPTALGWPEPQNELPPGVETLTTKMRGAAGILGVAGALTNNAQIKDAATKATSFVNSSMQIYDACTLLATASTGVGAFMALNSIAGSFPGFGGSKGENDTKEVMTAIAELLKEMQRQFSIVNGKLDLIIRELDGIRADIARTESQLNDINAAVRRVEAKLDNLSARLDQTQIFVASYFQAYTEAPCVALHGQPRKHSEIGNCLSVFRVRLQNAAKDPMQLTVVGEPVSLLGQKFGDVQRASMDDAQLGRLLNLLGAASTAIGREDLLTTPPLANPSELQAALAGYLAITLQYPRESRIERLDCRRDGLIRCDLDLFSDSIRGVRQFVTRLEGDTPDTKKANLELVVANYAKAVGQILDGAAQAYEMVVSEEYRRVVDAAAGDKTKRFVPGAIVGCGAEDFGAIPLTDDDFPLGDDLAEFLAHAGPAQASTEGLSPRASMVRFCLQINQNFLAYWDRRRGGTIGRNMQFEIRAFLGDKPLSTVQTVYRQVVFPNTASDETKPLNSIQVSDTRPEVIDKVRQILHAELGTAREAFRRALTLNVERNNALLARKLDANPTDLSGPSWAERLDWLAGSSALLQLHSLIALRPLVTASDSFRALVAGDEAARIGDKKLVDSWIACQKKTILMPEANVARYALASCSDAGIAKAIVEGKDPDGMLPDGDLRNIFRAGLNRLLRFAKVVNWKDVPNAALPALSIQESRLRAVLPSAQN